MSDGIDEAKLLETIAGQGEMIEELRDTLNELVSRRVPIAICSTPETEDRYGEIYVICDDGSMWSRNFDGDEWDRDPDIPQPEKTEESN